MNYNELKAEIQTGPYASTLAPYVTSGNDNAIADFLNSNSNGAAITLNTIPKQRVLRVFLKVAIDLATAPAALRDKWDRILPFIRDMEDTPLGVIDNLLALAVADGLLNQTKADGIKTRVGSRAEVLWGENQKISPEDVAKAVRGS